MGRSFLFKIAWECVFEILYVVLQILSIDAKWHKDSFSKRGGLGLEQPNLPICNFIFFLSIYVFEQKWVMVVCWNIVIMKHWYIVT